MKDFLGNPLSVGDQIVFIWHCATSSELREGEVVGFTPQMVKYYRMGESRAGRPSNITPRKVVKQWSEEQPPRTETGEIDWGELERRGDYRWHEQDTDRIRDGWSNGNSCEDRAHWRDSQ